MSQVTVDTVGGVGIIRVDRPPMNALDTAVQAGLAQAASEVTAREDIRAVVVHGGEKVFAAGADVKEMADWDYQTMVLRSQALQDAFTAVARIPKPTIAAITGYALGGGLELALACDLRVCGDNAKLGLPEILLGIIPGAGGTQRLPRLIGPARAKDLILTGRFVDAQEAFSIGLGNLVAPPDEVRDEAMAIATRLATGAALAQRAALEAIDRGIETDLGTGLAIERSLFAGLFATDDRAVGMESFLASGPGKAQFTGR